ncbi:hypothetical protein N7532_002042 [Penicillium argentinense]|uniref:Uncharacterized protein n=1 Tax=Penicillium argentinense TaxID=1131581 RepID=A0A9W9G3T1_9EURO|nr:uncharacterized protein N7532_002042 [Penicillium argentinense]KAJ5111507.1 hypothetical protein N7532_002042 [Penicillium argentinense]
MSTGRGPIRLPYILCNLHPPGGPELASKLLADPRNVQRLDLLVLADRSEIEAAASVANVTIPDSVQILEDKSAPTVPIPDRTGETSKEAGKRALHHLKRAVSLVSQSQADAIVFTPLNKTSLHMAGVHEEDELRWFAMHLNHRETTSEVNIIPGLWTARVTSHIAMKDVSSWISAPSVSESIELLHNLLGENGLFGREEIDSIGPAVSEPQAKGIKAKGPFPSVTIFVGRTNYDGIVTMYHYQGHIALKVIGFDSRMTVQGSPPVVIATPARGTAFDIAGKNFSSFESSQNAFGYFHCGCQQEGRSAGCSILAVNMNMCEHSPPVIRDGLVGFLGFTVALAGSKTSPIQSATRPLRSFHAYRLYGSVHPLVNTKEKLKGRFKLALIAGGTFLGQAEIHGTFLYSWYQTDLPLGEPCQLSVFSLDNMSQDNESSSNHSTSPHPLPLSPNNTQLSPPPPEFADPQQPVPQQPVHQEPGEQQAAPAEPHPSLPASPSPSDPAPLRGMDLWRAAMRRWEENPQFRRARERRLREFAQLSEASSNGITTRRRLREFAQLSETSGNGITTRHQDEGSLSPPGLFGTRPTTPPSTTQSRDENLRPPTVPSRDLFRTPPAPPPLYQCRLPPLGASTNYPSTPNEGRAVFNLPPPTPTRTSYNQSASRPHDLVYSLADHPILDRPCYLCMTLDACPHNIRQPASTMVPSSFEAGSEHSSLNHMRIDEYRQDTGYEEGMPFSASPSPSPVNEDSDPDYLSDDSSELSEYSSAEFDEDDLGFSAPLPRSKQSSETPANQEDTQCEFAGTCHMGPATPNGTQHYRKIISHVFGRNKSATKIFPEHVWVHYCRKHYQRARYRAGQWPFTQCELLLESLNRMESWGGVRSFELILRRREQERIDGRQSSHDRQILTSSHSATSYVSTGFSPRSGRRNPRAVIAPVPEWLRQLVGDGLTFDDIRGIIYEVREYMAILQEEEGEIVAVQDGAIDNDDANAVDYDNDNDNDNEPTRAEYFSNAEGKERRVIFKKPARTLRSPIRFPDIEIIPHFHQWALDEYEVRRQRTQSRAPPNRKLRYSGKRHWRLLDRPVNPREIQIPRGLERYAGWFRDYRRPADPRYSDIRADTATPRSAISHSPTVTNRHTITHRPTVAHRSAVNHRHAITHSPTVTHRPTITYRGAGLTRGHFSPPSRTTGSGIRGNFRIMARGRPRPVSRVDQQGKVKKPNN